MMNCKTHHYLKLLSIVALLLPLDLFAVEYRAKLTAAPDSQIQSINWDRTPDTLTPLIKIKNQAAGQFFVNLKGAYPKKHSNLIYLSHPIALDSKDRFELEIPITATSQTFSMTEIDAEGNVKNGKFVILFPDFPQFKKDLAKPPRKKLSFSAGMGVTSMNYSQTSLSEISEMAITLKLSGKYILGTSERWDVGISTYFTALPLSTNISGVSMRALGINLRLGYQVLKPTSPWRLNLMVGYYYLTTFTSPEFFGFRDVGGPQLFPMLSRSIGTNKSAWIYGKYSPIASQLSLLNLQNAEIAVGFGLSYLPKSIPFFPNATPHWISITADLSTLKLDLGGTSGSLKSYTLGFSYAF